MHDSIPTRGSLLAKIKDLENREAWNEFCATYGRLARKLALAARLTEDEAEDVVQEVFISVTRNIGGFEYAPEKCSFKHWLSQMVRWRIQDQLEKRRRAGLSGATESGRRDSEGSATQASGESEIEAAWEAEWKQHLIDAAAARVKEKVSAKQFQIFFLHVLNDMPVAEVIRRLKVTRTQVYLAKLRVGKLFREEFKAVQP